MQTNSAVWLMPGVELSYEQTGEMVDPGPNVRVRDPEWRAVDSNGHGHFAQTKGHLIEYPTLEWMSVPCAMGHGDDCDAEGDWHCAICGEVVEPNTNAAKPEWINGPRRYRLVLHGATDTTTYDFGPDKMGELEAAFGSAVREVLAGHETSREFASR